jgi:hypothetical protein
VADEFRWPSNGADLEDGLRPKAAIDALYAPTALRMDNRVPAEGPTFMAVCAPNDEQPLIVVVCVRASTDDAWTITGARDASPRERSMWRK